MTLTARRSVKPTMRASYRRSEPRAARLTTARGICVSGCQYPAGWIAGHDTLGRDIADAPESDSSPRPFPAEAIDLVVLPVSVHAFALDHFAPNCSRSGLRPGRWRAGGAPLKP